MPRHRKRMPQAQAQEICGRLRDFVRRHYGSWTNFETEAGIPRTTRIGWSRRKNPSVPEIPHLLQLARERDLNINWLLLGEGPQLRQRNTTTPEGTVLAWLEVQLKAGEGMREGEAEDVWRQLATAERERLLRSAVEGARPLYRHVLQRVRLHTDATNLASNWAEAWARGEVELTETEVRTKVGELLSLLRRHDPPTTHAIESEGGLSRSRRKGRR